MAVTIRDVAALAGVSPSTVSRTCQNSPSISEDTKRRVRQAAKQLGYAMGGDPAQSPAPRTIGVILPPSAREVYENPFYLEMIRGINQFCNAHQYVSTIVTGRDNDEILTAIRLLVSTGAADAFILLYSRQGDTVIDYLVQAELMYVLIGKAYAYANKTVYIDNDNFLAGQEATEYLIRRGHRRIAYLGSDNAYFSPPTAGAAIRRRWHWRISPFRRITAWKCRRWAATTRPCTRCSAARTGRPPSSSATICWA